MSKETINEKKACLELAASLEKRVLKHLRNKKIPIEGISEGEKILGQDLLAKYVQMPEEATELVYQIFRYSDNHDAKHHLYLTNTASSHIFSWTAMEEIKDETFNILIKKAWWPNNIIRFFLYERTEKWIKNNSGKQVEICLHCENDIDIETKKLKKILSQPHEVLEETKEFPKRDFKDPYYQDQYARRTKRIKDFRKLLKKYSA